MSGVLDKCLSNAPNVQLLEEEQAARSIVISNISPQTTKECVHIHFQRKKNGGGEIDHIYIPKKGTAVITFEKREVIETVLQHSHTLEGSTLKLYRLISDDSPEVLQRVEARINFDRFPKSSLDWGNAIKVLKDETEVQCRQLSNKEYVLCGTFNQIFTAQTLIQGILQQRSSVLQPTNKRGNDAIHQVDTTQTQQKPSEMWDIDDFNSGDVSSFEVQPEFMKFLKQVYKSKLQEIEETHGVKIVWIENASQVQIHSSEILNDPHSYRKGCDAFIDLYQKLYPNMSREVIDLKSSDDRALIIEAIETVEKENQVIVEIKGNKLLVFAEKNNITSSVQALKEKTNTNLGLRDHEKFQEDRFSVLKQLLSHGVEFSLYQSDITDERVDAIVNAANENLQHAGGVAAAIVRKGGRQIEEESRQIMRNRNWRPLKVGDAVSTRGGNLCCQFVIHTVGPRWNARQEKRCTSLLRRACVESLRLAAKLELCSIALPAISSGIFGMPKSICAQVMFQAVEEFSSSTDAEFSTLRDVRIVIIDDETVNVFREVFLKRYSSSTTSPHLELPSPSSNDEEESSSALKVVANDPPVTSSDNSSNRPSKKTGEDNDNLESPNKGVDPNADSSEPRDKTPDSIKEGHSADKSIAIANKDSPDTCIETSNVHTEVSALAKGSELSIKTSAVKAARGRGIAANFSGRSHGETGYKSSESTQLYAKTFETKSLNIGRGRGMTHAATNSPPGLTVTEEGQHLARDHANPVKGDENTDRAEPLMNKKVESERNESDDGAIVDRDRKFETTDQEETRPSNDGIRDPKKAENTKKNTVEKPVTGDERSLPTDENNDNPTGPMQPNDKLERGMQVDQSSSSAVNNGESQPEEPLPPDHLKMSPAAEAIAPTPAPATASGSVTDKLERGMQVDQSRSSAVNNGESQPKEPLPPDHLKMSPAAEAIAPTPAPATASGSVTVQDAVKERQAARSDAGSETLFKMQKIHPPGELKCSMCMNLNKDPVCPANCGHCFCKSCWRRFIEKAMNCPVCTKDNMFRGNQPVGYMTWRNEISSLAGYEEYGTIVITYNFKEGIQGSDHPNPGEHYHRLYCTSYLPNNPTGQEVCNLLRSAFDARLIFTIGKCLATGENGKIVSNGIELKPNRSGGPANCGYPDPSYLDRLKSQLAEKGITQPLY